MASCWSDSRLHKGVKSHLGVMDTDEVWKMKQREGMGRKPVRKSNKDDYSKAKGIASLTGRSYPVNLMSVVSRGASGNEEKAYESMQFQLDFKASLMGVHIYDEEGEFFSRQSSMSSLISEKIRSGMACISCGSEGQQGHLIDPRGNKRGVTIVATSIMSHAGVREQSGKPLGDNGSRRDVKGTASRPEKSKAASGTIYPSPQIGSDTNSSILNPKHLNTADARATGKRRPGDRTLGQLLGKSSFDGGVEAAQICSRYHQRTQSSADIAAKNDKCSPGSWVDSRASCPAALTFSERLFGYEFSRNLSKRLNLPTEQCAPSTQVGANEWQDSSHLGRCSISVHGMSDYDDTDEDDIIIEDDTIFQISNKLALPCSRERQHGEIATSEAKPRPSVERWSSNRKSYNLDLKQLPVKILSIDINGSRYHRSADPGCSSFRAKVDVSERDIPQSSLTCGGDVEPRRAKIAGDDPLTSDSRWLEFESEMNDFVLNSGRLKSDKTHEPDLEKPALEQVKDGLEKLKKDRTKMDEENFPFNTPVASSFLFGNGGTKPPQDAHKQFQATSLSTMPNPLVQETEFDTEDLDHSDAYHDPDDCDDDGGFISDTDSSLTTFSLGAEADSYGGLLDQPPQYALSRSFNCVRDVVDHNFGYLDIESLSGRFSVDVRRDKRLGKGDLTARQGIRLGMMKAQKPSSRRSLSPCLVCLSCWHQRPQDA
ncbi:uncharacterized protein [Physcomitrium patens]|uniref:Uncharacterized protein n=1 Tax=Physcomitrium patens TaxID=3218 RepID=A0A2K1IIA1_PHYPA|nr:uncharacterized protein LOC112275514 [Physcomitrium patens]XP_024361696.1 uncharacterized protein LOC112275514 [Physcomitrium patens]PNR29005.1 hypothetical protein PHYPA_027697 [Physcomitrium patens]|eukprot:XP_024361695.1 uncharacterized protein LOC112275514 [Physcomitrella patens]